MNQTYYSLGDMPVRDGPSMSSYHVCRAVPGQGYVLTCSNISSWEWRKPPGEIRIKNQEVSASWKLLLPCVVIDLRIAFVAIRTPKLIQVINYVIRKIDVCSVCVFLMIHHTCFVSTVGHLGVDRHTFITSRMII